VAVDRSQTTCREARARGVVRAASARGLMGEDEVRRWEASYDERVASGGFEWSVSFFITSGRKPAA
jgi:hypothetical protein